MAKQFLDLEGLGTFKDLLTEYIDDADAISIKAVEVSRDGSSINFYKTYPTNPMTQPDYTIEFPETDLSECMKLVESAVENNIAIFDGDGQVVDSDVALSDLATMAYVGAIPAGYEATTVTEYAKELADNVAANGYDDAELKARVTAVEEDVQSLEENKADKATTLEGYGIEDAYTKDETDEAIATAVANADHLKRAIVDELPDVAEADENTIYMVPKEGTSGDVYDEYMLINGEFELIGNSEVDLEDYAKKQYVNEAIEDVVGTEEDEAGDVTIYGALALAQEAKDSVDEIEVIPTDEIQALFN